MSFPWANDYKPSHPFMVWMDEKLPLPRFVYNAVGGGYPVPRNLNYWWNFGFLALICLGIQIVTGVVLAMHYAANMGVAFDSVEHIMRDVNWGWMLRYAHANGASAFFVVIYIHIFRGFFFGSYKAPREMVFRSLALPWHETHGRPGLASWRNRPGVRRSSQGSIMANNTVTGDAVTGAPEMDGPDGMRRRDFINIAAVSAAGVAGLSVLYPLISQMAPSADVLAESSTEVDVSAIAAGQAIKAVFRKQPVFVRNLTPVEIAEAQKVDISTLRDPQTIEQRTKPGKLNWLITMGVCTHLGCVPLGAGEGEPRGEFGGYFCPCHGSQYDTAARIRKGPAPKNLEVPVYEFTSATVVKIG